MSSSKFDIKVSTKDFLSALSASNSVMDKRSVNPTLGCVRLDVEDSNLLIQATDGSIFVKQAIGAQVFGVNCSVAVEGRLLERMIKGLNSDELSLKYLSESNEILVTSFGFELKLLTLPIEDFPKFPRIYTDTTFEIPYKNLYELLSYTEFASSQEEIRYNLNGVCLHSEGDKICAAATDVFRLATFFIDSSSEQKEFKIILPTKTIDLIRKIYSPNIEGHLVKAKISNNIIELSVLNTLMVSKLIDGVFPQYSGLIPKNNQNKLVINKALLASAIDRVSGINDERSRAVTINISQQEMEVSAYTQAKGEAKQSLPTENFNYQGDAIRIAFQPRYLLDVLNLFKEDVEVELALKDPAAPITICCEKLPNAKFVIMPIKI